MNLINKILCFIFNHRIALNSKDMESCVDVGYYFVRCSRCDRLLKIHLKKKSICEGLNIIEYYIKEGDYELKY